MLPWHEHAILTYILTCLCYCTAPHRTAETPPTATLCKISINLDVDWHHQLAHFAAVFPISAVPVSNRGIAVVRPASYTGVAAPAKLTLEMREDQLTLTLPNGLLFLTVDRDQRDVDPDRARDKTQSLFCCRRRLMASLSHPSPAQTGKGGPKDPTDR